MEQEYYKSGYQYAAGVLLSREKTPSEIAVEVNKSLDSFYDGMRAALRDYMSMTGVVYYGDS